MSNQSHASPDAGPVSGSDSNSAPLNLNEVLKKILTSLYLSPFCPEFRRPVRVLHPSLVPVYRQVVADPMDLGTVLLRILSGEYSGMENVSACSRDLALVFNNSIKFNSTALDMINISIHLLQYAQSLWEEAVGGPFADYDTEPRLFHEKRLEARATRFAYVRTAPLYEEDKLDFLSLLERGMTVSIGLQSAVNMCLLLCRQRIQSGEDITMSELLFPLVQQIAESARPQPASGGNVARRLPKSLEIELSFYSEATGDPRYSLDKILNGVDKDTLFFLVDLDNRLGEITCHVAEKKTRGYSLSAVWAHPHNLVWAQPNKSPWWPGMLLAGGDTPAYLSEINIRRLPVEIMRELDKLRPRVTAVSSRSSPPVEDGSAMDIDDEAMATHSGGEMESETPSGLLHIPANYCLVEFFGSSHDFGWVKTENVAPFPHDGSFTVQREGRVERCSNARAINEAIDAWGALVAAVSAPRDSSSELPRLEQLEADAAMPDIFLEDAKTPQKKRSHKKSAGSAGRDDLEERAKKPNKKLKPGEMVLSSKEDPGMRFKSFAKLAPYQLEVYSQIKQRSLADMHLVALYMRSVEPVGTLSSKHSVPPPPLYGVPVPPFMSIGSKNVTAVSEDLQPYSTPRVFHYVDPASLQKKCRKSAAMLAMDAANITEPIPDLLDKKKSKKITTLVKTSPQPAQDINSQKKRRSRAGTKPTVVTTSSPVQQPVDTKAAPVAKPVNLRSGKRIQWRQAQLLKFAKMRAEDQLDIPNLIAPTPDANGVNQLSEGAMHRNWATTLSTLSYQIKLSCSRLYFGEGVIHSEDVDLDSDVFFLEHKSNAVRKAVLKEEIDRIRAEIEKLQHITPPEADPAV